MSAATNANRRFRDAVYIPVDSREHSNAVSVDTDHNEPVDNGDSTATGTESVSTEDTPTSTRVPLPSEYSDILVETIRLVTTELESPESEIRTLRGRFKESYGRRSYSPLSIERVNQILGSQRVYRTLDGSFVYENTNGDRMIEGKIAHLTNQIVEEYIRASFDSMDSKSGGKTVSKDSIPSTIIHGVLGSLLRFARFTHIQFDIIQVFGTLGYHLQNNTNIKHGHLFINTQLYDGYIIALCTTDLIAKLDVATRQKSAHLVLLHKFTLYSDLIQLYIKHCSNRYILPVEYQKCYKFDEHSEILHGHIDFYKRSDNPQSENEQSIRDPHTIGHWTKSIYSEYPMFISNMCEGCDICNLDVHPINSSDPDYEKMLSLVPERGIFKLYTDWRLLVFYVVLIGAIATAVSLIATHRNDGIDPGGLTGTVVLIAIASIGFVRELFYPETELRDFLRAKVAISKFSKYCKQNGVCGSCVAALAVKNRADFGPVAVGPYASIAGGKPGPAERGKIFMDEPCDIKCFYAAGFAFTQRIQVISTRFKFDNDDDTQIAKMEWPSVFEQLVEYRGFGRYNVSKMTDYFIAGMDENNNHNVTNLVHGVATIRNDRIIRVEWLPIPINAVAVHTYARQSTH